MTISFSGLGSGMDYSSWIDALVQAKTTPITSMKTKVTNLNTTTKNLTNLKTTYSSLLTSLNKITDSNLSSSSNVFSQNKVSSSDTTKLSVTTSSKAAPQTLDVIVQKIASGTVAKSLNAVGPQIDGDTVFSSMANGDAKTGSFSFFVDNQKYSVDVEKTDTLEQVAAKMEDATRAVQLTDEEKEIMVEADWEAYRAANPASIDASVANGKFVIDAGSKKLSLGSAQDTSNFSSILSLKKDAVLNKYESTGSIIDINMDAKLVGSDSGFSTAITAGKFKIGKAEITIDENTTLNSLISKINSTSDSGVTANFDTSTGKLNLTSKTTGAFNINLENGTSNFLEAAGLTSGTQLVEGTQALGNNALLTINNRDIESFSNTVTSESTGIAGLVFNLNETTEAGKSVKVRVEQDSTQALTAVNSLITEFNNVMTKTDDVVNGDSGLKYESSLTSIKSKLRYAVSATTTGSTNYRTLADIGITTGKVGTTGTATTNKLQLDEAKFKEAMASDPDAVKALLAGDLAKGTTGFAGSVKKTVEATMDVTNGYFASKNATITSQLKVLNEQITRRTESVAAYKKVLTAQFTAMDQTISKLKGQYSKITDVTSKS